MLLKNGAQTARTSSGKGTLNKDQAAAIWPVMKAFSEGKKVQCYLKPTWQADQREWRDIPELPSFDADLQWRIKPELFEGKFVLDPLCVSGGYVVSEAKGRILNNYEKAHGIRIVTLREVEEK